MLLHLQTTAAKDRDPQAQPDLGAIDAFVTSQMHAHRIRGLALAITSGDEIIYMQGYGADSAGNQMTPQTLIYIGSISKSFVFLAIMQLSEQGKINLDVPVQTYLPWFEVADPQISGTITVRQLLNHTSGLSDAGYAYDLPDDATLRQAAEDLRRAQPVDSPGTAYHYFNPNFNTLGAVVETVSGQTLGEYVQQNIFDPLEMRNSTAVPEKAENMGVARGHSVFLGFPFPRQEPHPEWDVPAGQIASTAEDLAHYLIAQNNRGVYRGVSVLSAAGVAELHRPRSDIGSDYAMGWRVGEEGGIPYVMHGGSLLTSYGEVWMLPRQGYGIVINQNGLIHGMAGYPQISSGIIEILMGNQPTTGAALSTVYWVISAAIVLIVSSEIRWWVAKFPAWGKQAQNKSNRALALDAAREFIGAAILFLGVPYLTLLVMGQRLTWELGFGIIPDIYAVLWFAIIMGIAKGSAKAWVALKQRQEALTG